MTSTLYTCHIETFALHRRKKKYNDFDREIVLRFCASAHERILRGLGENPVGCGVGMTGIVGILEYIRTCKTMKESHFSEVLQIFVAF